MATIYRLYVKENISYNSEPFTSIIILQILDFKTVVIISPKEIKLYTDSNLMRCHNILVYANIE